MVLGLGKRDTCLKMSENRLVKDLKNVQIKYKKNAFSMNHFGQNFHFSLAVIFSKFLDEIKVMTPLASDKVVHFHKFEHLWFTVLNIL